MLNPLNDQPLTETQQELIEQSGFSPDDPEYVYLLAAADDLDDEDDEDDEDEPRRFTSQPTSAGGWENIDLDALERDAAAMSGNIVKHHLVAAIATERQRREGAPPLCAACLNGQTIATRYHRLVGHVCDAHFAECKQIEEQRGGINTAPWKEPTA
jgi:hypothetical protein